MQDCQRISLVVVSRHMTKPTHGCNHFVLAGVSLSGGVLFDRADRYALIRNLVVLAPAGERGKEPTVGMRRIGRDMSTHLLEMKRVDPICVRLQFGKPTLEAQKSHAAALKALRPKALGAARDGAIGRTQCPARGGTQVEGKNR